MVVDSLLQRLNAKRYPPQGYAYNLAMVVVSKHLNTAGELMQRYHRKKDNWCKSKGQSANPGKTEVVCFTRRREAKQFVRLKYQGVNLTLTKEVKYLSITLDEKLMRKIHIENQVKKWKKTLRSGYAFIGRTRRCNLLKEGPATL